MSKETDDTMRDHYDFSQGVRGKYQHLIGQPQTVRIHQADGTVTEEVVAPAIELDPDVRKYFPTSEAVNKALRGLIELIPDESSSPHSAT